MDGESDVEGCIASVRRIIGDSGRYRTTLDGKFEGLLRIIRQAGNACFSVAVGTDFEFRLPLAEESVSDRDVNLGVIDRFGRAVFHAEVRAAGAEAAVHNRNLGRIGGKESAAQYNEKRGRQKSKEPNLTDPHFCFAPTKNIRRSNGSCNSSLGLPPSRVSGIKFSLRV